MRLPAFLTLACLLVGACGFHLKGVGGTARALPFHTWTVVDGGVLQQPLETEILRQPGATLASKSRAAEGSIKILAIDEGKTVQTLTLGGSAAEYQLNLNISFQVLHKGRPIGTIQQVALQQSMDYSDSQILGKRKEEQRLREEMRAEAAERIVRMVEFTHAESGTAP